jgi:transposase-like protein
MTMLNNSQHKTINSGLLGGRLRHGSLFSGIGGFDIAAEWMGWENVFHCEIADFPRKVLDYHFPDAASYEDIKDLYADNKGQVFTVNQGGDVVVGKRKSEKYDNAVNLYQSGMSIADCAEFYEISRQAMHKILARRGCEFRDNKQYGEDNHFYRGCYGDHSKKKRVHHITEKAIHKNLITNPGTCETCGSSGVFRDGRSCIQAHHDDYDKPLEVRWLCQKCHHEWHKNNKAKNSHEEKGNEESAGTIDVLSGGFP